METRRRFIEIALGFLTFLGVLFIPLGSVVKWGFAKTRKLILPKGTKRGSLIEKNPAQLDTRNLEITPLKEFGTMGPTDHEVDLSDWRLEVDGYVKNPLRLTYQRIIGLPWIEKDVLLICPGVFANHGRWKGVSIKEFLEMAGWKKDATHVTIRGPRSDYEKVERYPLTHVLSDKVFLAYQVNGEVLPKEHGFPLRVVAEGYYGYDWIKYVYKITIEKVTPSS